MARKTSGSLCGRTGSQIGSSNPSTISSITAATLGTPSSISLGKSCPSRAATGQPWVTQCEYWYKVSPGAHAILLLDQAGWHGAKILKVPRNITLMPLPPRAPELNGQENIWQFIRQNQIGSS